MDDTRIIDYTLYLYLAPFARYGELLTENRAILVPCVCRSLFIMFCLLWRIHFIIFGALQDAPDRIS